MTDAPFGRQPKPTTITIEGGDNIDRYDMALSISQFLRGRIDIVERSLEGNREIIRCYPRAVND